MALPHAGVARGMASSSGSARVTPLTNATRGASLRARSSQSRRLHFRPRAVAAPPAPPAAPQSPPPAPAPADNKNAPRVAPEWLRRASLARSPPWASVQDGSCLMFNLGGALPEVAAAPSLGSAPALTLPALLDTLKKAAVDPRISGVFIKFTGTACGWGKLAEVRRALLDFRKAGKYLVGACPTKRSTELLSSAGSSAHQPASLPAQAT